MFYARGAVNSVVTAADTGAAAAATRRNQTTNNSAQQIVFYSPSRNHAIVLCSKHRQSSLLFHMLDLSGSADRAPLPLPATDRKLKAVITTTTTSVTTTSNTKKSLIRVLLPFYYNSADGGAV